MTVDEEEEDVEVDDVEEPLCLCFLAAVGDEGAEADSERRRDCRSREVAPPVVVVVVVVVVVGLVESIWCGGLRGKRRQKRQALELTNQVTKNNICEMKEDSQRDLR